MYNEILCNYIYVNMHPKYVWLPGSALGELTALPRPDYGKDKKKGEIGRKGKGKEETG